MPPQVVVKVYHRGTPKMVGKVIALGGGAGVFLHEQSGTQYHRNLDAPVGVDACVVTYLQEIGVDEINVPLDRNRTGEARILVATVEKMLRYGIRQTYDARDRYYLPARQWQKRFRVYDIPWVTAEIELGKPDASQLPLLAES